MWEILAFRHLAFKLKTHQRPRCYFFLPQRLQPAWQQNNTRIAAKAGRIDPKDHWSRAVFKVQSFGNNYYYHFVEHCGAFFGLKFGGLKCILARLNKPMKSENQTVVRFKQQIKIEKPQNVRAVASYCVGERNDSAIFVPKPWLKTQ